MQRKTIDHFLTSAKASLNHPLFYPRIFALISRESRIDREKSGNPYLKALLEEYDELSRRLDRSQIQESCSVRNMLRSRQLANLLISDKGELNEEILPDLIKILKDNLYSLGPQRQYDAKRQEHILGVLNHLASNKEVVLLLKKIDKPYANRLAEDLIRQTLQLPPSVNVLTDAHARRAVLTAWLCLLRQNVGSCFATAPAEIIQAEQPEQFLQDMLDLLTVCRLKRTFEGVEYSVPLSDSWGNGDLKKPLLVQITSKGITPEIWCSPGLTAAFEVIGLLSKTDSIKDKNQRLLTWIEPIIKQKSYFDSYCVTSAEEIIRLILLQSLGLSEQQLKEFENRPRGLVHTQMVVAPSPHVKRLGTVSDKCANFYYQFHTAKNAFKALTDNPLLKAWEFTLASFSETKLQFTSWNLYASLGMGTNEPGGIGQCIQKTIQNKIDYINKQTEDLQYECEATFTHVKTLESRLRHTSENEMQWVKMEYQNRLNEYYHLEEQKKSMQRQSKGFVRLYENLYQAYQDLFKDYFQEVYDAEMQEVSTNPFDDTPAGFRLVYKHGRTNPSQWTRIKNLNDFIDALSAFFVATEPHIASLLEKGMGKDLSEVVSSIIFHIKTHEFQESAFHRMAAAHNVPPIQDPLRHLEQIEKKPWAYTSGGTMNTLVSCYYGLHDKPQEQEKWVENEMELLVYIVDTLKQIPNNLMDPFLKGKRMSMLMQSPTHAFLLKPLDADFKEAWQSDEFTYTSLRDRFILPAEIFVREQLLNDDMIYALVDILTEKIPENFQPRFRAVFRDLRGPLTPLFFREAVVDTLNQDRGLHHGRKSVLGTDEIDSTLFSHLPFFPVYELEKRVREIFQLLPGLTKDQVVDILEYVEQIPLSRTTSIMSAFELQNVCKSLLCLREMKTTSAFDYHKEIHRAAQKLGYAIPAPVIFGDTNWVKEEFGFVVNPGTARLELWRLDYIGSTGYPMSVWKEWVNGTRSDLKWGIYVKPSEYGQS